MTCPICGEAELVHDTRDIPYIYKGESTVIPSVTGDFCPACGESVLALDEARRLSSFMLDFNRQVDASYVEPEFVTSVRQKLDLDEHEANAILGGGVNGFAKFEKGKARPPLALVKLLKVLDRHPELLSEVRAF